MRSLDPIYPAKMPEHVSFGDLYEMSSMRNFLRLLQKGDVFLDVGAMYGIWSVFAWSRGAEVHAFDVNPSAMALLREHLKDRGTVVEKLVWDLHCALPYEAAHGWIQAPGEAYYETVTLDDYCRDFGKVSMIKIDVEGNELHVLQGAMETLKKFRPVVMVEVHTVFGILLESVIEKMLEASTDYYAIVLPKGTYDGHPWYHALFKTMEPESVPSGDHSETA